MWKRNAKISKSASGVSKIRRDTYNTTNGFSKVGGWWAIRAEVWKRDKGLCQPCLRRGTIVKATDVHHIIPLSRGGTTTKRNLMCICDSCHEKRHPGNKHLVEYHRK